MAQLAQRLGFDLADPFARDREVLAHFFERVLGPVAHAEAHLDDTFFARRQRLQHRVGLFLQVQVDDRLGRRHDVPVLDEVAKMRIFLFADGRLERDGLLRDLHHLADLRHGNVHPLRDFFRGGLAAQFLHERARRPDQLVDRLDHVHRDPDGARLVGNRAGDGLADPPRRVGRELVAAPVLELVDRLHQADVAFLDQVEELQAAVRVLLRDGHDQAEVGLDQFLLGLLGLCLAAADRLERASGGSRASRPVRRPGAALRSSAPCAVPSWTLRSSSLQLGLPRLGVQLPCRRCRPRAAPSARAPPIP